MSPTARTLQFLRSAGITCQVVEKWNPHAKVRQDLFGCIDILAMLPKMKQILGIQATSGSNHSARMRKAMEEPKLHEWLRAGGHFVVWSWSKTGAKGKRKVWTPRVTTPDGEERFFTS